MNEKPHQSQQIADAPRVFAEPSVPEPIEAWVCAGGIDTRYRRAGTGPCVLVLLHPFNFEDTFTAQVLATLSRTHRVVIVEATDIVAGMTGPGPTGAASWLCGLIEGLGVAPVGVIASTTVEAALREYLSTRPEAPACVLWLHAPTRQGPQATLETPQSGPAVVPLRTGIERFADWLAARTGPSCR